MLYLFDAVNYLFCLTFIVIISRMKLIPGWIGLTLSLLSFIPFLLNDFLFSSQYFPDQYAYTEIMKNTRSLNLDLEINNLLVKKKYIINAWVLSVLPLPFVETLKSLGFYNWFLFILIFLWLYKKNFLVGLPLYFILFYPSLVLYTSLSLREPLILCFMILSVIFLIEKKYFKFFLSISPLALLKFQNFFLLLILLFFFLIFDKKKFNKFSRLIILVISILITIPFLDIILNKLEYYRYAFFLDNGGDELKYIPITNLKNFLFQVIHQAPYFLIKPFPWEVDNVYQLIQSLENIIIIIFLVIFTKETYKQSFLITNKWLLYLFFVCTVYGLVVYNFGTATRYRYSFITIYVLGLAYELYREKGYLFKPLMKIVDIKSKKT